MVKVEAGDGEGAGRPGRPKDWENGGAILDAGWALFLERGIGAVSTEAIATRAGVSKMTVYGHLTDKHAPFEKAVLREMRAIEAAQNLGPPGEPGDDGKVSLESRLRVFGLAIMSFLAQRAAIDFYNVLAGELRRHPELVRAF